MPICAGPHRRIGGRVSDASGATLNAVAISLTSLQAGHARSQSTDADGLYRFAKLPIERYSLQAHAPQFAKFTQEPIEVPVSQTIRVDVEL